MVPVAMETLTLTMTIKISVAQPLLTNAHNLLCFKHSLLLIFPWILFQYCIEFIHSRPSWSVAECASLGNLQKVKG